MGPPQSHPTDPLAPLRTQGFLFLPRARTMELLEGSDSAASGRSDWTLFAESWNTLGIDTEMADRGRYRRRRHALLASSATGPFERLPDAPHYQGLSYNRLNGGIERWFEPVENAVLGTASFQALFEYARQASHWLRPGVMRWQIEVHQFRIEAQAGTPGQPTPEGIHRDGVDFVMVALVHRENIQSGTTTIHGGDGTQLGAFTLTDPFDLALVDDQRVWHGVTALEPGDPAKPAWRDVLVLTFRDQVVPDPAASLRP